MEWLTVQQMAERRGCSPRWVQKLIKRGDLHAIGEGRQRLVWASNEAPIAVAGMPDPEEPIEPQDDVLRDLYHHLQSLITDIDTGKIGRSLREEIEQKGAELTHVLGKAKQQQRLRKFYA